MDREATGSRRGSAYAPWRCVRRPAPIGEADRASVSKHFAKAADALQRTPFVRAPSGRRVRAGPWLREGLEREGE